MKYAGLIAALVIGALPVLAGDTQSAETELPLRTKTEITVVGRPMPPIQLEKRKPNKLRRSSEGTLRGFGLMAGWLMNANDDIPSPQSGRVLDRNMPDVERLSDRSRGR